MLTHVMKLTADQKLAVIAALDERAHGCLIRIRESIENDILTADEVKEQVKLELEWLHPTIDALALINPGLAARREEQLKDLILSRKVTVR